MRRFSVPEAAGMPPSETSARRANASKPGARRGMGTRLRVLTATLVIGALPLVIASVILPTRVQSALADAGERHLAQTASGLAAVMENELARQLETVRGLAAIETITDAIRRHDRGTLEQGGLATANRQLNALLRGLEAGQYQGLWLCGADGLIFAGVLKNGETAPYVRLDVRDRLYLHQARRTMHPVISDPLVSRVGGIPIIVIAVPITDEAGGFAGLIGLSIEVAPLAAIISEQKIGRTGYPFAIDREGLLLAHPDPQRALKLNLGRMPGTATLARRMMRGESGMEFYRSSKGDMKVAAFAPVPITGWSVAASIETDEFAAPARDLRRIILVLIGACIVLAAIVALIFATGIEQLKRALAESQQNEERFKRVASVATDAVWEWDLASDRLWWSDDPTRVLGDCSREEGETLSDLFGRVREDERPGVAKGIRDCPAAERWTGEHHFRRRDGTWAYVLHRAVAVHDPAGRPVRVIGSLRDFSLRRAHEEKLAEQAALLDQTRDGIMVRDMADTIRFWSRGAERLYGWTAEESIGRTSRDLLCPDEHMFLGAETRVRAAGEWSGRLRKRTKDGRFRVIDCRWTLLRDDDARPKSILTIDTDITEREEMEEKFLRAQRLESIGTLAGGIAHDLNNLLAPVVMGVGMLKLAALDADDREVLGCIGRSAQRGTQLVKQVLSFARGVEGSRVAVHVGYVVREVADMLRSTLPKDITLRVNAPKDLWLITADPTQINQVLLNLCVNARDAMPAGGRLTVSVRNVQLDEDFTWMNREVSPGPHVAIEVADTGTGMTPEVRERLFEPFFTTKPEGKGTGLGLATVIGIVRSHRGTINVYSEPGRGSVFNIYLPAADHEVSAAKEDGQIGPAEAQPRGQGECILLVEDEATILTVTEKLLRQSGYDVLAATDGAQALALYEKHRAEIALVFTDLMMPVMGGAALMAELRRLDPELPVIAASGLGEPTVAAGGEASTPPPLLVKPYTATDLLKQLASMLAGRRARTSPN